MNLGNAATQCRLAIHLCDHIREEQHLPIACSSHEGELLVAVHHLESWVAHGVLATHHFEVFLPALTVWWIGEHKIKLL